MAGNSDGGLIYLPIFREGRNERKVMKEFSGLQRFRQLRKGKRLIPLVEITANRQIENLPSYRQAADELLVEFPEYLSHDDGHALEERIDSLLEEYGDQEAFYSHYQDEIEVPVISGRPQGNIDKKYDAVKQEYDEVAVRLLLSSGPGDGKLAGANELGLEMQSGEIAIFDLLDIEDLEEGGYDYLGALEDVYSENRTIVANAINVFDDEAYNWSPETAVKFGFDGFGDFTIGGRYPPIIPDLQDKRKIHRQYAIGEFRMNEFEGETYEEAAQRLESWEKWREDHCPFCQKLGNRESGCTSHLAKQVQVGHYIHSVFENDLVWMANQ